MLAHCGTEEPFIRRKTPETTRGNRLARPTTAEDTEASQHAEEKNTER